MPPSASTNMPGAIGARVGEGAALVAEQLALEQRVGDGGAVDRHERPLAARAVEVDAPCATSSLPVPDSPVMSTVADEPDSRRMSANTSCIAADLPMMFPKR